MQELYYNGKLILGVDHGYGNMKTAHRAFAASVEKEVQLGANALEYKGKEYGIGGGHKEFQVQKINDEDYWILTLAAVAEELKFRGKNEEILHLAAGVPLFWVKEQKESFREYLLCEKDIHFKYNGESYHVVIADASIHPQGYAAFINYDGDIRGNTVLADIGNGTMNVAFMQNRKPLAGKIFTEQFGVYQCMKKARNEVMRNCQCEVPDHIIEEVFRKGTADIPERYIQAISEVAKDYVKQVFSKLREYGYNPDLMKLYVIGGGGCLIKNFAEYDADRVVIIQDICATAKGYELLALQTLKRTQSRGKAS